MIRVGRLAAAGIAAAGMVMLAGAGPALAAQGSLRLDFRTIQDPQGCYDGQIFPLVVGNHTDQQVTVYAQPGCQGDAIGVVPPGQNAVFEFGASVNVP